MGIIMVDNLAYISILFEKFLVCGMGIVDYYCNHGLGFRVFNFLGWI
jgi:hypothetical protein